MNAQVVSFRCILRDRQGRMLSSFFNRDVVNQLGRRGLPGHSKPRRGADASRPRGLVANLQNVREGERREFLVSAQDAYGLYDPALVMEVPRTSIPGGFWLRVGSEVQGTMLERGSRRIYRVTHIQGENLILDANHPLAGYDLLFDVEILSARAARHEDFSDRTGRVLN